MVDLTTRFARLAYEAGQPDRGHSLMETVLHTFPRRSDVWNQWVDMEFSLLSSKEAAQKNMTEKRDPAVARSIFERGAKVEGLKKHAAEHWFRRWAAFEELHGDGNARAAVTVRKSEWKKAWLERKANADK